MRCAVTRSLAALCIAAGAVPALAGSASASFELDLETGAASVSEVVGDLPSCVAEAWEGLSAPDGWDESAAGPFALLREHATYSVAARLPSRVAVVVSLELETPVRSETRSAVLLAEALCRATERCAEERVNAWKERRRGLLLVEANEAERAADVARAREAALRREHGDVATEKELIGARLRVAAADLASARVDRAAVRARLETARRAVEWADRAAELRRRVDELEAARDLSDGAKARLAEARERLAEAEKGSPPLDQARRTAFELEVELAGLDARVAALEPEITELRARSTELVALVRDAERARSDASLAEAAAWSARMRLRDADVRQAAIRVLRVREPSAVTPR